MRTLNRAFRGREGQGRRLTLPWPSLNRLVTLRTQELALVIAAPGGGKSTFARNLVLGMPDEWTLYIAQDTPHSVVVGLAALALGKKVAEVGNDPDPLRLKEFAPRLVVAEGAQSVEMIDLKLEALREWIGRYPSLVVIDNLIDLTVEGESYQSLTFYSKVLPDLKQMAIRKDLAMVILHHVTKTEKEDGKTRLTLADSLHAGGRDARHVWGIYHTEHQLYLSVLKQNNGVADASGNILTGLSWEPEFGRLRDFQSLSSGDW